MEHRLRRNITVAVGFMALLLVNSAAEKAHGATAASFSGGSLVASPSSSSSSSSIRSSENSLHSSGVNGTAALSAVQFARESSPASRLQTQLSYQRLPLRNGASDGAAAGSKSSSFFSFSVDLQADAFLETGAQGQWGFDFDPFVGRLALASAGHLWLGRTHPLQEGLTHPLCKKVIVTFYDAFGANWVQNQMDALNPRVSGWVGVGWHKTWGQRVGATLAYSPLFIPTRGPRLDLSETSPAKGSRYTRLPPQTVNIQGEELPLRYKLETGEIQDIVFQHQFAAALDLDAQRAGILQLAAWRAPSPDPVLDISGKLKVSQDSVHTLVTARPTFPYQNYVGVRWRAATPFEKLPLGFRLEPEAAVAHELTSQATTYSLALRPHRFVKVGYLTTVNRDFPQDSATYARDLAWAELSAEDLWSAFVPTLLWQHHFTKDAPGDWVRLQMKYKANDHLAVFGDVNVFSGSSRQSYFGAWRALDSIAIGTQVIL